MQRTRRAPTDPGTILAAAVTVAGIVWLGPLMFDQFVLFGDRDQAAEAAAARAVMPWPALLVAIGATILAVRRQFAQAVVAALPLVAVVLAWTTPQALYQLLAYGIAAPPAVGALLAATVPLRGLIARPVALAGIAIVAAIAVPATPFLAGLTGLAAIAWWALSRWPRDRVEVREAASALD